MNNIITWLKDKLDNFVKGLDNNAGGMSLRKLLAVGFFWLTCALCIRYTDKDNVVAIVTILTSMITALIITYTVGNIKEKGMEQNGKAPDSEENR